jgi:hypothetical protein
MVQHVEPITRRELQMLQSRSSPDVAELETMAAKSELFTRHDLDATLLLHDTEGKNEGRHRFHWSFTIPTVVAVLVTILMCNTYPNFLRNVLCKIRTSQPSVNPNPGKNSQNSAEATSGEQPSTSHLQSNDSAEQSQFVAYSIHPAAWTCISNQHRLRWETTSTFFFVASRQDGKSCGKTRGWWKKTVFFVHKWHDVIVTRGKCSWSRCKGHWTEQPSAHIIHVLPVRTDSVVYYYVKADIDCWNDIVQLNSYSVPHNITYNFNFRLVQLYNGILWLLIFRNVSYFLQWFFSTWTNILNCFEHRVVTYSLPLSNH